VRTTGNELLPVRQQLDNPHIARQTVDALTEIAVNGQQVQAFVAVGAPATRRQLAQQLHQRFANIGLDVFVFAVAVQRQPAMTCTQMP
jgi:hypothetical protein